MQQFEPKSCFIQWISRMCRIVGSGSFGSSAKRRGSERLPKRNGGLRAQKTRTGKQPVREGDGFVLGGAPG